MDRFLKQAEWTNLTTGENSDISEEIGSEAQRCILTTGENYETNEEETGTESILSKLEEEENESFELSSRGKQRNDQQDDLQLSLETSGDIGECITTDDEAVAKAKRTDLKFGDKEKDQTPISFRLLHLQSDLASLHLERTSPDYQLLSDQRERALSLLRTTYIAFPIFSASEVFLIGSFDGWTNQRRMKRLDAGVFSLNLMLYPGQYEIKFIVNGKWMTDPLRPVANPGPYQNNLLIVSES